MRFFLNPIDASSLSDGNVTQWDFAAMAVGCRDWQDAIEANNGQIYGFHDQSLMAAFPNTESSSGAQRALKAAQVARKTSSADGQEGFQRYPFCAAVAQGEIVSGLFGNRIPGLASVAGRIGDFAYQIASKGYKSELGYVDTLLTSVDRTIFESASGTRRVEQIFVVGIDGPIQVTFIRLPA